MEGLPRSGLLGAVGGMFGRTGSISAATNVAAVSSATSGSAKYGSYQAQLNVDGAGGNARFNATRGNLNFPDTFQPWAGNRDAKTMQVGRVLCERASVVIFTKDSFTFKGKLNEQGAAINTRLAYVAFTQHTGAQHSFPANDVPQAYFCVRRYKTEAEGVGLGIPEELYGQTIAVELARGGHFNLFGIEDRNAGGNYAQNGIAAVGAANVANNSDTIFKGRFEAKEGEFPPSMTIDGGAVVAMTNANISTSEIAGRWDKFEVHRFTTIGNSGDARATTAARTQLSGGMAGDMATYNVATYNNGDAGWTALLPPYGPTNLVPNNAEINSLRICPTHSLGRYKYILTPSGPTSACSRNDLGARSCPVSRGRRWTCALIFPMSASN